MIGTSLNNCGLRDFVTMVDWGFNLGKKNWVFRFCFGEKRESEMSVIVEGCWSSGGAKVIFNLGI